jgi:hypothetical protein
LPLLLPYTNSPSFQHKLRITEGRREGNMKRIKRRMKGGHKEVTEGKREKIKKKEASLIS